MRHLSSQMTGRSVNLTRTRPTRLRPRPLGHGMFVFLAVVAAFSGCRSASAQEDTAAAINLHSTGIKAYEEGEFQLAIDQWKRLLAEYPDYSARRDVKFQIGQSWFNLVDYGKAATEFRELRDSIEELSGYKHGPGLLVFLGFSEYSVARQTKESDKAQELLRQAIANYELFHEKFPQDALADQAWFFEGEALSHLNELSPDPELLERAGEAFQKVVEDYPESKMYGQALAQTGLCLEQSGDLDGAASRYREFLEQYAEHEMAPSVEFWNAETTRKQAAALRSANDSKADERFREAISQYDRVLERAAFPQRDVALYHKAFCLLQLGEFQEAADAYATLHNEFSDSKFAAASALAAGKYYLSANNLERAGQWLKLVNDRHPELHDEAAHWLCRVHLQNQDCQAALDLANAATADGGGGDFRASLLMDGADALHELPERRAESIPLYHMVAREFPDDPLAAKALYFAAFANQSVEQYADAIRNAQEFKKAFPGDALIPDVLRILGDAAMKTEEWPLAQSTFEDLIERFPEHESRSWWETRVGWTLNLQNRHNDAVASLSSSVTGMADPASRSEAYYVMGSSWFQLGEFARAAEALRQALSEDPDRGDASDVRLLLVRVYRKLGDADKAREVLAAIPEDERDAGTATASGYLLAELEYEQGNYAEAITHYTSVIESAADAQLPDALYGRGWAYIKTDNGAAAIEDFNRLINEFPENSNRNSAFLGRAVARRAAGQFSEAVEDLDAYLATSPPDSERQQALYERGMTGAAAEQWDRAVGDFRELVDSENFDATDPRSDNVVYQLAWALKKKGDAAESLRYFQKLADEMSASEFASEAHYHVGEAAYESSEWEEARARYEKCLAGEPSVDIGERAAYKLAWCAFEQEDWDTARTRFQQQVEQYPDGPLKAIGLSMVAESFFQNKNHADAITAYKVAIPAIRTASVNDESVRILAPLHAAQAANKTGDYEAAREFAQSVIDEFPDSGYRYPAMYELGAAYQGLGEDAKAIEAWQSVAENSIDKTGARARAMIGEQHFKSRDYDRAIEEFKLVMYGYPEPEGKKEIDPWRAFSAYETARCYYVQINDAAAADRGELIKNARHWFEYLITNFKDDALVGDAKKQLDLLEKIDR